MEQNKKCFILYLSLYKPLQRLTMEQRGEVFTAIFEYLLHGTVPTSSKEVSLFFDFMQTFFDEAQEKYQKKCEKSQKAAQMRWHKDEVDAQNADACVGIFENANSQDAMPNKEKIRKDKRQEDKKREELIKESKNPTKKENKKEKSTSHFVKPTIAEIEAYCRSRNNRVNAEQFFNFYEAKGWMLGKNHIKNWKCCVHTWEQRSPNYVPVADREKAEELSPEEAVNFLIGGTK